MAIIKTRNRVKAALAALLLGVSAPSSANLLEYRFQGANGQEQVVPPDHTYINVSAPMTFTVIAGLDRKVRASILDADKKVLRTQTSGLLGVTDRITVNGKSYYGDHLTLQGVPDGTYTIRTEILTSGDLSVQAHEYPLVVDRAKPAYSSLTIHDATDGMIATGSVWKLGRGRHRGPYFMLSGISDNHGIKSVSFRVRNSKQEIIRDQRADYDRPNNRSLVYLRTGSEELFSQTNLDEDFEISFIIEDEAGNVTESRRQKVRFDNVVDAPQQPFGVYDPGSSNVLAAGLTGYVPYSPGMEVKTNPVRLAWRVPKSNWHEYHQGGLKMYNGLGATTKAGEDKNYVYVVTTSPFGNTDANHIRWVNFGQWGGDSVKYSVKLAPNVPKSPKLLDVEYLFSDTGWSTFKPYYVQNSRLPVNITSARPKVEPRGYTQTVVHAGKTCTIPAGQSTCVMTLSLPLAKGTTGYLHDAVTVWNADKSLRGNPLWAEVHWNDQHYPSITPEVVDDGLSLRAYINQPGRGLYFDRLKLKDSWLEDGEGNRLTANGGLIEENEENYTYQWELTSLPEGDYELFVVAEENHGPKTRVKALSFTADKAAPELRFNFESGDSIGSLDDIKLTVTDEHDPDATITQINMIGGPASDDVQLSWRKDSGSTGSINRFELEYPLMFPSMAPGEEYTLSVTVKDHQGNQENYTREFMFSPRTSIVNGQDGIFIPAITESIVGQGLPPIYSEPVTLDNSTPVVGEYDLVVSLRSDSDFGINILGYEILPGDTVIIDNYDFSANGSRVVLPVHPTEKVIGTADLLVFPGAPGSEYVLTKITTWEPDPVVLINDQPIEDGFKVEEALERVTLSVVGGPGDRCTYTSDQKALIESNPIMDPMCLVDWTIPSTLVEDASTGGISGYLTGVEDDVVIGYEVFLPQGSDIRSIQLLEGQREIDIVHPDIAFEFSPNESVIQHVSLFTKVIRNIGSTECKPNMVPSESKSGTKYGKPQCLIEWLEKPDSVAASHYTPTVQGVAEDEGPLEFRFDVTYFDPEENPYFLTDQVLTVDVEPPKPIRLTLPESSHEPDEEGRPRYFVGVDGEYLGEAHLSGSGADIDIEVSKGGERYQGYPYRHRRGREHDADHLFRIWMDDLELWEETAIEVHGAYNLMPSISQTKHATVIGVPSPQIRANIEVEGGKKQLDTSDIEITASLDGLAVARGYFPEEHGYWDVQIRYEQKSGEDEALTEWVRIPEEGSISEVVRLGQRSDGYLYAVVKLDSPMEDYSREMISNRHYVNVLRGGEIDGEVTTTRVVGPSIFSAFLRVNVPEMSYSLALGDVEWLMSTDGGDSWEQVIDGARGDYMRKDFAAGRYQIKARLHNKHTGATSETGIQEIHVYDVPRVEVVGPAYAFTTQETTLKLNATLDWEPVPIERFHVEWSEDDGETWEAGLTKTISYDGENDRKRYRVRVRDKDAPMDRDDIYRNQSHLVNFIDPEGPRARITGPRRLERGDPGDYTVDLNPPRRNMDVEMDGEWVLPDGTTIPGTDPITYNPSEEDVQDGRVGLIYRSWVVGFRDQGAVDEKVHRISAWQYEWPEWDVFTSTRAMEAPAQVRLVPRTPGWFGWLDNEQYDWTFPAGSTVVDDNVKRPTVLIEEPGEHLVSLLVSDARGNETEIVKTVTLAEPEVVDVNFSYYTDNQYMRAPLEIRPRIYMTGGHRLDRVNAREIIVNGEVIAKDTTIRSFPLTEPGEYQVTAKIYTTMGKEASTTETITVVPNKPPVCEPEYSDKYGYLMINANCTDEDGRIYETRWMMDGEELPTSSYRYRFTKSQLEEMGGRVTVTISAKDDSGAWSQGATIQYQK